MIINVKFPVLPFKVPSEVALDTSSTAKPSSTGLACIDLKDIEANTLSDMCDVFRKAVFIRAGKSDPAVTLVPVPMSAVVELGLGPQPYFGKPAQGRTTGVERITPTPCT